MWMISRVIFKVFFSGPTYSDKWQNHHLYLYSVHYCCYKTNNLQNASALLEFSYATSVRSLCLSSNNDRSSLQPHGQMAAWLAPLPLCTRSILHPFLFPSLLGPIVPYMAFFETFSAHATQVMRRFWPCLTYLSFGKKPGLVEEKWNGRINKNDKCLITLETTRPHGYVLLEFGQTYWTI